MEFVEVIGQLVEYGIAFATLAAVVIGFLTDNLTSGKSRDREINRERELTNKSVGQVDGLTDAIKQMSDAWERRLDIDEARQRERELHKE